MITRQQVKDMMSEETFTDALLDYIFDDLDYVMDVLLEDDHVLLMAANLFGASVRSEWIQQQLSYLNNLYVVCNYCQYANYATWFYSHVGQHCPHCACKGYQNVWR